MAENGLADGDGLAGHLPAGDGPEGDGPGGGGPMADTPAPSGLPPVVDMHRLVAEHADALYRYAFRLTGGAADAEDLTQQTFLIAHRKIDQLRDERSARVWLMTVMRRTYCRSQIRNRTEREKTVPLDIDTLPADEVSDHWEIDRELLQIAIDELPEEFKLVLLSFYFEDRSYREIAEQFELPIGTVMSRLARAKSHLRSRLFEAELQSTELGGAASRGAASRIAASEPELLEPTVLRPTIARDGANLPQRGG
jgi:RNA polymerase sigma-70 factor (ECF subfamily)